jgi:hypothetical protein
MISNISGIPAPARDIFGLGREVDGIWWATFIFKYNSLEIFERLIEVVIYSIYQ